MPKVRNAFVCSQPIPFQGRSTEHCCPGIDKRLIFFLRCKVHISWSLEKPFNKIEQKLASLHLKAALVTSCFKPYVQTQLCQLLSETIQVEHAHLRFDTCSAHLRVLCLEFVPFHVAIGRMVTGCRNSLFTVSAAHGQLTSSTTAQHRPTQAEGPDGRHDP